MQEIEVKDKEEYLEKSSINSIRSRLRGIVEDYKFQNLIIGLILLNGIVVVIETYPVQFKSLLHIFDRVLIWTFVVEMVIKMISFGLKGYFKDGWNKFDFTIVTASLIFYTTPFVSVMRLLRVLRLLRMISAVPSLRKIVDSLIKSIPALTGILGLAMLIFSIYAIIGTTYFRDILPAEFFGSFHSSLFTLSQVVTFESWASQVARPIINELPWAWIYFESFIIVGSLVILNLVVAVILNYLSMEDGDKAEEQMEILHRQNQELKRDIQEIKQILLQEGNKRSSIE